MALTATTDETMSLRFQNGAHKTRQTRGLTNEAIETLVTVYIGNVEFGHYFRITRTGDFELRRWSISFAVGDHDTTGIGTSECEVREKMNAFYNGILKVAGLMERSYAPQLQPA